MTTTSRSEFFTPVLERGTPELRRKHRVEAEPIDLRGLMKRHRVTDQCELDRLFLCRWISAAQHSAGENFMDALVRSGATPRSSDPDSISFGTLRDAEGSISARIMIASGAHRALNKCSPLAREVTIIVVLEDSKLKSKFLDPLREGLNSLVRFFGTAGVRDPRG